MINLILLVTVWFEPYMPSYVTSGGYAHGLVPQRACVSVPSMCECMQPFYY